MSRFAQLLALLALGLATPFAAWGLGADFNATPGMYASETGAEAQFELELPPGLKPPECGLKGVGDDAEETDEVATACCWVFYFGMYWCVPC